MSCARGTGVRLNARIGGTGQQTVVLHHGFGTRQNVWKNQAEDLIDLMHDLNIHNAHFIGHSVGGTIGIVAANSEPGLFRGLSLLATSARYLDDRDTGYAGGFNRDEIDGLIAAMHDNYAHCAGGLGPLLSAGHANPQIAHDFTHCLLSLRPDIAAVPMASTLWIAKATHAAGIRIIDTDGHFPQLNAPESVNQALLDFLSAHAAH